MATMRLWRSFGVRPGVLAAVGYLASGCGDAGRTMAPGAGSGPLGEDTSETATSAALTSPDAERAPAPDGCNARLSPVIGATGPAALGAGGPWQYCGAYGTGGAHLIKVSADSRRTAVLTDSGQAWVLDTGGFAARGPFSHGNGAISFVGLSSDGRLLATVDDPGARVGIWDVNRRRLLRVMQRPPLQGPSFYGLGDVAFSRDGRRVAVVSGSHVDVFDVVTGAPLPISARTDLGGAMRVAFAASDDRLVLARFNYFGNGPFAGFGFVVVVDAATGDNPITLAAPPLGSRLAGLAVSGNGSVVAVGASEPGSVPITLFDPRTGAVVGTVATAGVPLALDFSGSRLAVHEPAAGGTSPPLDGPQTVSVRRTSDGMVVRSTTVPGSSSFPRRKLLAVTPDVKALLVGDVPPAVVSHVRISDGATRAIACGSGHTNAVEALALTPDGQVLVSTGGFYDGNRRLAWDVATGAPLAMVPDPTGLVGPSPFSPDGTHVAEPTDPESSNFVLRDAGTGQVVRTFGPQPTFPSTFDFSPDGELIASTSMRDPADRRAPPVAGVWIAGTGQLQQSLLIVTSLPSNSEPVLFATPRRLLVGGYATTALWCQ
jgi:WD40 repeat protein